MMEMVSFWCCSRVWCEGMCMAVESMLSNVHGVVQSHAGNDSCVHCTSGVRALSFLSFPSSSCM